MPPYTVLLVNHLPPTGATQGTATISMTGPAGVANVLRVEIDSWSYVDGGHQQIMLTVRFDPKTLTGSPTQPFAFEVKVTADPPFTHGGGIVMDGDDELADVADIETDYAIKGEGAAAAWMNVTAVAVKISIT